MAATRIKVFYRLADRKVSRIVLADEDDQYGHHRAANGEGFLFIPRDAPGELTNERLAAIQKSVEASLRVEKKCGDCTKCCEGWLTGEALGHRFYPGKPCHFLGGRCTIYSKRPHDPCVTFKCEWLVDDSYPEWMRPDRSHIIVTRRAKDGVEWIEAQEAGRFIEAPILNWLILLRASTGFNLRYQVHGAWNWIGDNAFCAVASKL